MVCHALRIAMIPSVKIAFYELTRTHQMPPSSWL
jgi:hypothetical protein